MDNNTAFVAVLRNIQKIEGADKIVQADVTLNGAKITQVVVGVDTQEDTKVVYFDSNLCIEQAVIEAIDKLDPKYGAEGFLSLGNYLSKGNRVKVVKLRGVISNGLAVDIHKFFQFLPNVAYKDDSSFEEGASFVEICGTPICHKYLPPSRVIYVIGKKGKTVKAESKVIPGQFHFHVDTDQLPRNMHRINPQQIVSISRKVHGTSAIVSNCLTKRKLSLMEKIAKKLGIPVVDSAYEYLYASRTVIKNEAVGGGFYGTDLWTRVGEEQFKGKLHAGESVYYEIVGYIPGTTTRIQKGYRYGCKEGEYKIAVYRITQTNVQGTVTEYSWQMMKERCVELQVPMVQEYYFGVLYNYSERSIYNGDLESWNKALLSALKQDFLEKKAEDCDGNPDEGIVLRIEGLNLNVFKYKSEAFLLKESKNKDEEVEDIEEQEQVGTL